jgi:hypothetical protein
MHGSPEGGFSSIRTAKSWCERKSKTKQQKNFPHRVIAKFSLKKQ